MKNSIPNDFSFAISDGEALEAVRQLETSRVEHEKMLAGGETRFDPTAPPPEGYMTSIEQEGTPSDFLPDFKPWYEEDPTSGVRFDKAYKRGLQILMARARARARIRASTRHYRTQTRTRARRSPASTRRATVDSGGDDGGDPEPPRPPHLCHLCSLPALCDGGAL